MEVLLVLRLCCNCTYGKKDADFSEAFSFRSTFIDVLREADTILLLLLLPRRSSDGQCV